MQAGLPTIAAPQAEADLICLYYSATRDESRRQEFLSVLPFVYTPYASRLLEEFLVAQRATLLKWMHEHKSIVYLHTSQYCLLKLHERARTVTQAAETMHAAISPMFLNLNVPTNTRE